MYLPPANEFKSFSGLKLRMAEACPSKSIFSWANRVFEESRKSNMMENFNSMFTGLYLVNNLTIIKVKERKSRLDYKKRLLNSGLGIIH